MASLFGWGRGSTDPPPMDNSAIPVPCEEAPLEVTLPAPHLALPTPAPAAQEGEAEAAAVETKEPANAADSPELERLKEENKRLLEALAQLAEKCLGEQAGSVPKITDLSQLRLQILGPDGTAADVSQVLARLKDLIDADNKSDSSTGTEGSGDTVRTETPETVVVVAPLADEGEQVAVVDVNPDDYWVLVDRPDEESGKASSKPATASAERKKRAPLIEEDGLGGDGYEIVKEEEILRAVTDYIMHAVKHTPEARRLPPSSLKRVLEIAFAGTAKQSPLSKLWEWGMFAYNAYAYARVAYMLYKHPAMLRIIVSGVYNLGKWVLLFCL